MRLGNEASPVSMKRVVAFSLISLTASALVLWVFAGMPTATNSSTTGSQMLRYVTVFGLASTIGQGTHVVALDFTNTRTGANFVASVSDGKFSISLPNAAVYDVAARWAGDYSWQKGAVDRGDLMVNMSAGSMAAMSYNLQLDTPPTIVATHGTILGSLPSAQPVKIVYTAAEGESFQADVQNVTFSARLPNLMDYQVKVFWLYADGTANYPFAKNQTLSEGIGVVGVDVVIS